MGFKEIEFQNVDWTHLTQDEIELQVPKMHRVSWLT
jgi:hypothetical protein